MKTQTITLIGTQKYWSHQGLNQLIQAKTDWDKRKVEQFLIDSQTVMFHKQTPETARKLVSGLEQCGFTLDVQESKAGIRIALALSYESEISGLRDDLEKITQRVTHLETLKGVETPQESQADLVAGMVSSESQKVGSSFFQKMQTAGSEKKSKGTTEENIGKHWLSRIGIFTLLLGVVFLITYTSRSLGAWGKLCIGACVGLVLIGVGNFLATKKEYAKWAMAAIGGGWAITYFTFFAAYHVPIVKVIQSPIIGLSFLLMISVFSIMQSLQYRSVVLVFMSYFLAFIAMVTTDVSFYTLVASFFLAVSIVVVSKKLGWSWLAFLGLLIVYGTHWVWLEPSIYWAKETFAGQERFWEMLYVPWAGNDWKVYPIIDVQRSILHLSFLVLYWILFTAMGYVQDLSQKHNRLVTAALLFANGLIFSSSFIHHLHVYYPDMKYLFAGVMAILFFGLSMVEKKRGFKLLSDIYMGFTASLVCLMLPLYVDGSSVTYGWSVATPLLVWLGMRYDRTILRWAGGVLGCIVLARIVAIDYLDRKELIEIAFTFYSFFMVALLAGLSMLAVYYLYAQAKNVPEKEKRFVSNASYIAGIALICSAVMIGGLREVSSFLWLAIGCSVMYLGIARQQRAQHVTGAIVVILAVLRFISVDTDLKMVKILSESIVAIRYGLSIAAFIIMISFSEWIRKQIQQEKAEKWYFWFFSIMAAFFFLTLVADKSMASSMSLIWGIGAFAYIMYGFRWKEKTYRWIGLSYFIIVIGRLFLHDFAKLEMIYRIISFMGLGAVLIVASLIYSHYSKTLLNVKNADDA